MRNEAYKNRPIQDLDQQHDSIQSHLQVNILPIACQILVDTAEFLFFVNGEQTRNRVISVVVVLVHRRLYPPLILDNHPGLPILVAPVDLLRLLDQVHPQDLTIQINKYLQIKIHKIYSKREINKVSCFGQMLTFWAGFTCEPS